MADDEDIPADISLLLAFANTLDERSFTRHGVTHSGGDEFGTATCARRWLAGHALLAPDARLTRAELANLVTFRDGLRLALAAKAGSPSYGAALTEVNTALARAPLVLQFGVGGVPLLGPGSRGTGAVIAGLAAIITATAAQGGWHRLRMCAAPDCRWVFYDSSRRGGGRWCSMAVCGNRFKTRRYRQRQAQAAAVAERAAAGKTTSNRSPPSRAAHVSTTN